MQAISLVFWRGVQIPDPNIFGPKSSKIGPKRGPKRLRSNGSWGAPGGGSRGVWGHPVYSLYTETPNLGALHQPIASETWVNNKCIHGTGSTFWRGYWPGEGPERGSFWGAVQSPKPCKISPKSGYTAQKGGVPRGRTNEAFWANPENRPFYKG